MFTFQKWDYLRDYLSSKNKSQQNFMFVALFREERMLYRVKWEEKLFE